MVQHTQKGTPPKPAALTADPSLPLAWRKWLAGLAMIALAVFILRQVGPILTSAMQVIGPFLLALIVAYVFHPVVVFVQRRLRLGRITGIFVVAGIIALAFFALLAWLIPTVYQQLALAIKEGVPWVAAKISDWAATHLQEPARGAVMDSMKGDLGNFNELARRWLGSVDVSGRAVATGGMSAVIGVAGGVVSIGALIGSLSIVAIIAFYLLADFHRIPAVIRRLLPERDRERIWGIMVKADTAVGGFLRGQIIVCLINGSMMAVLLGLVGMGKYAILIGFIAGILNFVPYLGPIAGFLPGALWIAFSQQAMYQDWSDRGKWFALLVVGFTIIQTIEGFVLQPYIVGKHASLHPLMVMAALVIGAQGGLGGMIVAVPIAAVVKVAWVELFWKNRK